jgi:hypothetical protein
MRLFPIAGLLLSWAAGPRESTTDGSENRRPGGDRGSAEKHLYEVYLTGRDSLVAPES